MTTLNDLEVGALLGTPTRVTDGTTTQIRDKPAVLHRILVGAAPAANRTITLRNGDEDTDPIVTQVVIPAAISYPVVPLGLHFSAGLRAIFSGAVDVTFIWTPG